MLFSDTYYTIANKSEGVFRDRGSKFLAYTFPVRNEEEIKACLHQLRKEHPSARHHCYAWRLGTGKEAHRVNDDGEPSGTAGKPIFSQIQSNDLTQILIVVVRYFGGTLLGTGGLIHAYREAAAEAIKNSHIEEKFILFEYRIEFEAEDTGAVMQMIRETGSKIGKQDYTERNCIDFTVRKGNADRVEDGVRNIYKAKLSYLRTL